MFEVTGRRRHFPYAVYYEIQGSTVSTPNHPSSGLAAKAPSPTPDSGQVWIQPTPNDGERRQGGHPREDRIQQRRPLRVGVDHDDWICTSRWMHRACGEHQAQCKGDRASVGRQTHAEKLERSNTRKSAEEMPAEECARLSRRGMRKAEQKDGASPERGQHEGDMRRANQEKGKGDCACGAEEAPGQASERVAVHVPSNDAVEKVCSWSHSAVNQMAWQGPNAGQSHEAQASQSN